MKFEALDVPAAWRKSPSRSRRLELIDELTAGARA
jgi:hypothetical protein